MKKKLLILFLTCVLGWLHPINAQEQETITIGSGDEKSTAYPFDMWNTYGICQIVYTPQDINNYGAADIVGFALKFYGVTNGNMELMEGANDVTRNFRIYLENIDETSLSSYTPVSGSTLCYEGNKTLVNDNWTSFEFTESFSYEGNSILVTIVDNSGYSAGNNYYTWYVDNINVNDKCVSASPTASFDPSYKYTLNESSYRPYSQLTFKASGPKLTLEGDTEIYLNESTTIRATAANFDGDVTYSWSLNGEIVGTGTDAEYTFDPSETGIYTLTCTATDTKTNKASASVTINVIPENPFAGKQFRVKVEEGYYAGYYLDVYNDNGTIGVETKTERNTQIFTIEIAGNQYYLKTADGNYIKCETGSGWWNVHAYNTSEKTPLVFEYTNGEQFYIKDYDKMTGNSQTASNDPNNCYFKVENQKVYCDAPIDKYVNESHRTVLWSLEECVAFGLELSANNTSVCEGDAVELTATVDVDGTYYYTWAVKDGYGSGKFSTVTEANTIFTPSTTGNCVIKCSVFDGTSTVEKEISLTVYDVPELTVSQNTFDIDANGTATFEVTYSGNDIPSISNDEIIDEIVRPEANKLVITTKPLRESTELTFKLYNFDSPYDEYDKVYLCAAEETVTINVEEALFVELGTENDVTSICEDDANGIQLVATPKFAEGDVNYSWTPEEGLDDPTSARPTFIPSDITEAYSEVTYTCTVKDDGGTTSSDKITLTVYDKPELNISEYVTVDSGEKLIIPCDSKNYTFNINVEPYVQGTTYEYPNETSGDYSVWNVIIPVTEDGQFTVTANNAYYPGCAVSKTINVSVVNCESTPTTITIGDDVQVDEDGDGWDDNYVDCSTYNNRFPIRSGAEYSVSQQIYTAEELTEKGLGVNDEITSIAFKVSALNDADARTLDVYLINTNKEGFDSENDYVSISAESINYTGPVTFTDVGWTTINLETPLKYEGGNVLVCLNDRTNRGASANYFCLYTTKGEERSIGKFNFAAEFTAPDFTTTSSYVENNASQTYNELSYNSQIQFTYTPWAGSEDLVAEITADKTSICEGEDGFNLKAAKVKCATYAWYNGENLLGTGEEFTYSDEPGTYTIRLVVTQNDVTEEDTKVLTINPKPSAELAMENTYVGVKTKFTFPDDNEGVTYTVTFTRIEDGLEFPPAYNVKNEEYYDFYTFNETGTYMMDVVANSNSLCENSQDEVALITVYPAADFIADNFCAGSGNVTTFNNTTAYVGGQVFTWDFGDGSEPLVSNASTVTHEYPTATVSRDYNVTLTVENGTSSNVKTQVISINAAPIITDITLSKTIVIDEVTFTAEVTGAESESWKVNGTPIVGNKYVFDTTGDYTITVTATSSTECTSEYSKIVHINDKSSAPIVNGNQSLTEIDLGFRPVESWMRPIDIKITPDGSKALRINSITIDDKGDEDTFGEVVDLNYLKFTSEVGAYEVEPGSSLDLQLTHDVDNEYLYRNAFEEPGTGYTFEQESALLTINYGEGEEYNITLKYTAYPPVTGDVVEFPHVVTFNNDGTYTSEYNSDVLANYLLPGYDGEYYDAVYKIELDTTMAITARVTDKNGDNGRAYIYDATFGGEGGPGMTNFIGYEEVRGAAATAGVVEDMMLKKGTYYLVAASESANFSATITSTEFGKPWPATSPTPVDYARGMSTELNELQWTFGKYTAEYQVMFGTEQPFTDENILVNWSADIDNNSCALNSTTLSPNTLYYWQVNAKNEFGDTTGTVWNFATEFDKVQNLALSPDVISVGDSSVVTWTAVTPGSITGYNVLADGVKVNKELITGTTDTITNLGYKAEAYNITVQAVYNIDGYEIYSDSEPVKLYVLGDGQVDGYVYAEDGEVIEGASVTFGTKTFTTNAQGYYSGTVTAGTYNAIARKSGYKKSSISDVSVPYNGLKSQDFILPYNLTMAENVVAVENRYQTAVDVTWKLSSEDGPMFEDFENGFTYKWETSEDYPWKVVANGYEEGSAGYEQYGAYCVKSTNSDYDYDQENDGYKEDNNYVYKNTASYLQLTAHIPFDGKISFDYRIESDQYPNGDCGKFYIGNDLKVTVYTTSENENSQWRTDSKLEFDVKAGTHTFKWEYSKDNGWYSGTDAFFIDNISFYETSNLYNVYLKDILTENEPTVLADSLTEKEYNDASWATIVEDGIYQWGVSVLYNDTIKDLLNEDFEGVEEPETFLTDWTKYTEEVSYELFNQWHVAEGGEYGIPACDGAGYSAFVSPLPGKSVFYFVTPMLNASRQATLEFDYIIPCYDSKDYPNDFSKFKVAYSTKSSTGPWTDLTDFNKTSIEEWEHATVELPLEEELYIAFIDQNVVDWGLGIGLDNVRVYSEGRNGESKIAWSNLIGKGNELIVNGSWDNKDNWSRTHIPTGEEVAVIKAAGIVDNVDAVADAVLVDNGTLTIGESGVLTAPTVIDSVAADITINAGGQLVHNNKGVMATFVKNIAAYTSESDGWYTISSPLATDVNASDVTNLLKGDFDLYRYDEPTHYWENYEDKDDIEGPDNEDWGKNGGVIEQGRGYLYANLAATELSFVGELNTTQVSRTLSAQAEALRGFNLLGNPFAHDIYKGVAFAKGGELRTGYYTLDNHGAWQASTDDKAAIKSGAGFLVQTDTDATQINIDKVNAAPTGESAEAMLAVAVVNDKYEDIAYVTFNEGLGLEKIGHMNENIPMVYVPSNFNSFAIATVEEDVTEIPVNFEAMTMGEYTIGVKAENCEYKVMTLVDNLTGVETNLLKDSYTFMATTTDDPDRFLIKLSKDNEEVADSFIYINNGELIFDNLSNDAIINVFDVLGRNVATFNNCGDTTYRVSTDLFADGVYMVRLIEGNNVKVQKMVIE